MYTKRCISKKVLIPNWIERKKQNFQQLLTNLHTTKGLNQKKKIKILYQKRSSNHRISIQQIQHRNYASKELDGNFRYLVVDVKNDEKATTATKIKS